MTAPQDPYAQLPGGRLDPALDPDRYDPARNDAGPSAARPVVPGRLDPTLDPDRYVPERQAPRVDREGGTSQTLTDLLSEGSFDDPPSPYVFLLGLAGVAAFLLLVAFVFAHLSP